MFTEFERSMIRGLWAVWSKADGSSAAEEQGHGQRMAALRAEMEAMS